MWEMKPCTICIFIKEKCKIIKYKTLRIKKYVLSCHPDWTERRVTLVYGKVASKNISLIINIFCFQWHSAMFNLVAMWPLPGGRQDCVMSFLSLNTTSSIKVVQQTHPIQLQLISNRPYHFSIHTTGSFVKGHHIRHEATGSIMGGNRGGVPKPILSMGEGI